MIDPVYYEIGIRMYLADLAEMFRRAFPARFFLQDESALNAWAERDAASWEHPRAGAQFIDTQIGGAR